MPSWLRSLAWIRQADRLAPLISELSQAAHRFAGRGCRRLSLARQGKDDRVYLVQSRGDLVAAVLVDKLHDIVRDRRQPVGEVMAIPKAAMSLR